MKKILLLTLVLTMAIALCACGGDKYTTDEVKAALEELLPKSYEMNVIYFGEGLPISEDKDVIEEFYQGFESDIEMINYHPVSSDCPYQNETELRDATLEVYTEEYAEFLFQRAFRGISDQLQNVDGHNVTYNAIYAMYIEENGVLTVRLNLDEEAIPLNRTYDVSALTIVSQRGNVVQVEIPSYVDGQFDMNITLRLVQTENGWRLDSPTY